MIRYMERHYADVGNGGVTIENEVQGVPSLVRRGGRGETQVEGSHEGD